MSQALGNKIMVVVFVILFFIAMCLGCATVYILATGKLPHRHVITDIGVSRSGYCNMGLYMSKRGSNVLDKTGRPITCSGYIHLTDKEAEEWR